MKAEEFLKTLHKLDEVFKLHDDAEYNERQLTQFAERYHENELKLLSIADVSKSLADFEEWACFQDALTAHMAKQLIEKYKSANVC